MEKVDIDYWAKEVINKIVENKPDIKKVVAIDILLSNLGEVLHVTYLDSDNEFGSTTFHKQGEKITEYGDARTLLSLIKLFDDYKTDTDTFKEKVIVFTICLVACILSYVVTYNFTQEYSALLSISLSMYFGFKLGKQFNKEN